LQVITKPINRAALSDALVQVWKMKNPNKN